jgi:hypothetical protein
MKGDNSMDDQRKEEPEVPPKKKKTEEPVPFCTAAASAEHARAESDDEPCDDSRSGE